MRQISRSFGIRGLFLVSALFPTFVLCRTLLGLNFTYFDAELLAALQLTGALAACSAGLFVATVASYSKWRSDVCYPNVSACLLAMGIGSAALAMRTDVDEVYLFIDTCTQVFGALFMGSMWFWGRRRLRHAGVLPALSAIITLAMVIIAQQMHFSVELLPGSALGTTFISASNFSGIVFLFSAAIFFCSFRQRARLSDLIFCYFALLSGISSVFWAGLRLWGPVWWVWHLMQPFAYLLVLAYTIVFHAHLESELEASEKRFQTLANSAFEGIIVVRDGVIQDCNAAFSQMFGRISADIIGSSLFDLFPGLSSFLTESSHSFETTIRCGGDRETPVEIRSRNEGSSRIIVVRDLTEEKRLALKAAQNEARFAELFENSIDGVAYGQIDGSFLKVNDALCAMTGYDREELCSHTLLGHPLEQIQECARPVLPDSPRSGYEYEREIQRKDGTKIAVLQTTFSIAAQGRSPVLFGTFIKDVTEKKIAEQRLNDLNEELLRSNEQLDRFASIVSHDLAEPLRTISMFLSLLQKRNSESLDADSKHYLSSAAQASSRLRRLIDGFLVYARVGANQKDLVPTDSQLALSYTLQNLETLLSDTRTLVTHGKLPLVHGDPSLLEQLFLNLIGNAIKYCSHREPRIDIQAHSDGSDWIFAVRDNGNGIPADHHRQIFNLFARADPGSAPGTGIGLATSKRIVELLGGRIWVESHLGQGSTFFFSLPSETRSFANPGKSYLSPEFKQGETFT